MSLKSDIQSIYETIVKIENDRKKANESSSGDLFGGLKIVPKAFPSAKMVFDKLKFRQYFAQPYNFIHLMKFLDINSILNVGLINREFNVFVSSIYIFKVIYSSKHKKINSNNPQSNSPKSVSSSTSSKSNKSTSSPKKNYVGGLFKNIGNFFLGSNKDCRPKVNPSEISMKLNLHEEILNKIKKKFEMETEIRNIREDIDCFLNKKKPKSCKKVITLFSKSNENVSDYEYLSINKEVIQKEHSLLEKDIVSLNKEVIICLNRLKN